MSHTEKKVPPGPETSSQLTWWCTAAAGCVVKSTVVAVKRKTVEPATGKIVVFAACTAIADLCKLAAVVLVVAQRCTLVAAVIVATQIVVWLAEDWRIANWLAAHTQRQLM